MADNGKVLDSQVQVQHLAHLATLTPDGQQVEARVYAVALMNGQQVVLGEVVFRSFQSGTTPIEVLAANAPGLVRSLIVKARSGLTVPPG